MVDSRNYQGYAYEATQGSIQIAAFCMFDFELDCRVFQ